MSLLVISINHIELYLLFRGTVAQRLSWRYSRYAILPGEFMVFQFITENRGLIGFQNWNGVKMPCMGRCRVQTEKLERRGALPKVPLTYSTWWTIEELIHISDVEFAPKNEFNGCFAIQDSFLEIVPKTLFRFPFIACRVRLATYRARRNSMIRKRKMED